MNNLAAMYLNANLNITVDPWQGEDKTKGKQQERGTAANSARRQHIKFT